MGTDHSVAMVTGRCLPPVYVMAVGHTVTQQPSWSSAQTLAFWLRALLALAGPVSGLELGVEAVYRDRGTAESYPGLPASSRVCEAGSGGTRL